VTRKRWRRLWRKLRALIGLPLVLAGCADPCPNSRTLDYQTNLRYDVEPTSYSPDGVGIVGDPAWGEVIDSEIADVNACLETVDPEHTICRRTPYELPYTDQLTVRIATPDEMRMGGHGLTLLASVKVAGCGKGYDTDTCYYRSLVQQCAIVTVPDQLLTFRADYIRVVTGCSNPWQPELAPCAGGIWRE